MITLKKLIIREAGVSFSIYPNGVRSFNEAEVVEIDNAGISGIPVEPKSGEVPALAYDSAADLFQKIQLRDNTEYDFSIELPLSIQEFVVRCEENNLYPFANQSLKDIVRFNGPDSCAIIGPGIYRLTGRLNFENRAGAAYLDIELEPGIKIDIAIEVLTQKIDYQEEFQQLLHQISEFNAELIIKFDTATESNFTVTSDSDKSPIAELMAFRRLFRYGRITTYVREIINNPSTRMSQRVIKEHAALAPHPDWPTLMQSSAGYDFMLGGPLNHAFHGYTPWTVPERKLVRTTDTTDNRFIKYSLQKLSWRLVELSSRLPKNYSSSRSTLQKWVEELDYLLSHPFWSDIGVSEVMPNTMVMVNRKGYREFLMSMLTFGLSIKLEQEESMLRVGGEIKPVFHLYEIWCYLQIHQVLSALTGSRGNPELSFANKDNNFMKDLISKNDRPIHFVYSLDGVDINILLYYNKDFHRVSDAGSRWEDSYSGVFNPDISISMELGGVKHWLHFDSKYRLDFSRLKSELNGEAAASFKRDDIHKMHTYRDALMGTRGSYILYPGSEQMNQIYVRHPLKTYRDGNPFPSVGAFPLKPTQNEVQRKQVDVITGHLKSCLDNLISANFQYQEELGIVDSNKNA